jgi:5-(carboxyamino)imidazole ribonucleotide synthase
MAAMGAPAAAEHARAGRPTVGIVGAGQLARMCAQAAISLDVGVRLLAESPLDGAAQVTPGAIIGSPFDPAALARLAEACDVMTFDHELVAADAVAALEARGTVARPPARALAIAQDKLAQRGMLAGLGLPQPAFRPLEGDRLAERMADAAAEWGWPVVVKSARGGYDGRGVWFVEGPEAAADLADRLGDAGPVLVEEHVALESELAAVVVRRPGGETVTYPVVGMVMSEGICRELTVPASVPNEVAADAIRYVGAVAAAVDVVGILALELFRTADGLLCNEIAVRPHNSAHFTLGGCVTSQFENHLRAVLDLPLGDTSAVAPAIATVNVIAADRADERVATERLTAALAVPGVAVHRYGKEPRPGRKVGHVTALGTDPAEVRARARAAAAILAGEEPATAGRTVAA